MIFNKSLMHILTIVVAMPLIFSCKKQENPTPHGYSWTYIPRDCEYLNIWDSYVDSSLYFQLSEKKRNDLLKKGYDLACARCYPIGSSPHKIKASIFSMMLSVTSYTIEMAKKEEYGEYSSIFLSEPDNTMEEAMEIEMNNPRKRTRSSTAPMMFVKYIEYRKIELRSLKITSTSTLFGIAPESDLTDRFEIFGDESNDFLFNFKKELLGYLEKGMTIDEYLALRPIVNPKLYIHLKDVPPEVPVKTDFIVEMELDGGKTLRDTTTVTLTR